MTELTEREGGYLPIGAYGLIGDCRSAALVSVDGSIDWCCLPRFDSPSVFGRILDSAKGGFWQIRPPGPFRASQRYRDRTNLIATAFSTPTGRVRITDFMPIDDDTIAHHATRRRGPRLVRIVDCLAGHVSLEHHIEPMPNYGRDRTDFQAQGHRFHGDAGGEHYCVVSTEGIAGPHSTFSLDTGGSAAFSLRCANATGRCTTSERAWTVEKARRLLRESQEFWRHWVDQVGYTGPYTEPVWRSALALKLMAYAPTGALIAAPTTSLPEALGGQRNWDYRFTWLRDASFTLYALFQLGLHAEAHDFFQWLRSTGIGVSKVQNLYRVDGDPNTSEEILDRWTGYRGSRRVRIGNAAVDQLQLDVFGELLDSAYLYARFGGEIDRTLWKELHAVVDLAIDLWVCPDASIWESRGRALDYTYSKMMCWVAVDRGLRLAERFTLPHERTRWLAARREMHRQVTAQGYNRTLRSFTQTLKGHTVDAAMLRLSQVRFLDDRDPRVISTVRAVARHLGSGALVSRYRTDQTDDGIDHGEEGAFLMCSFWLVDALAHIGDVELAQRRFEDVLSLASPVGLMAEEVDVHTGELLGNYPQAFTHLALIGAAVNIERARHRRLGVRGLRAGRSPSADGTVKRHAAPVSPASRPRA